MTLPAETAMKLAANELIHRHGDGAEEYATRQLRDSRHKRNRQREAQWLSMLAALNEVRALRATIERESCGLDPANPTKDTSSAARLAKEVGGRIRELRLQHGLSRRDLATKLRVSYQQIHKYEAGQDTIPLHRLLMLASLFDTPAQVFWEPPESAASTPGGVPDASTLQLVRAYQRISNPMLRKRLLQLVKEMAGEGEASPNA